jgi:hypothetical protein
VSEIQEILTRFWDQLIAQPSGPLAFRFILQPITAITFAIIDGPVDRRQPQGWKQCQKRKQNATVSAG